MLLFPHFFKTFRSVGASHLFLVEWVSRVPEISKVGGQAVESKVLGPKIAMVDHETSFDYACVTLLRFFFATLINSLGFGSFACGRLLAICCLGSCVRHLSLNNLRLESFVLKSSLENVCLRNVVWESSSGNFPCAARRCADQRNADRGQMNSMDRRPQSIVPYVLLVCSWFVSGVHS